MNAEHSFGIFPFGDGFEYESLREFVLSSRLVERPTPPNCRWMAIHIRKFICYSGNANV
jgi:hypothetical protein